MKKNYLIILLVMLAAINQVYAQAPKLTAVIPASGPVGTKVTIYGSGFSEVADNNVVYFGATRAIVAYATATQLFVKVPAGATFKPITISNKLTSLIGHSGLPFNTLFSEPANQFDPKVRLVPEKGASDVQLADIDGDGKTDILATNPKLKILMIFRNISKEGSLDDKSFAAPVIYSTGRRACFLTVDDMNGDGKPDVVLVNGSYSYEIAGYNSLTVLRNLSTPGFIKLSAVTDSVSTAPPTKANSNSLLKPGNFMARIADFDGDGKPDLAVLDTSGFVSVYRNIYSPGQDSTMAWAIPDTIHVGGLPNAMVTGDMDGDGKPDIITTNAGDSTVTVLRNITVNGSNKTASFQRMDFKLDHQPLTASLADVDGDGKLDIVVGAAAGKPTILIHNSSTPGHFAVIIITLPTLNLISNYKNDLVIQDLDGDGKPDMLSLEPGQKAVSLHTQKAAAVQTGSDYFNPKVDCKILSIADCIGDLDGDGLPDMVVASCFGIDIYHAQSTKANTYLPPAITTDSLFFHRAMSPNGDGVNDVFTIDNIDKFPQNTLVIVNIGGTKIFEETGYGSTGKVFDRHSNITGAMQKPGTYFYLLEYKADNRLKSKTGYFVLKY